MRKLNKICMFLELGFGGGGSWREEATETNIDHIITLLQTIFSKQEILSIQWTVCQARLRFHRSKHHIDETTVSRQAVNCSLLLVSQ